MTIIVQLKQLAQKAQIEIDQQLLNRLELHWQLLDSANKQFNLTAITDQNAAADKHYLDCLLAGQLLIPQLDLPCAAADIGTGGGFPGLVLAAMLPDNPFTLIESSQKKAAFLGDCAQELALREIKVLPLRAEQAGQQPHLRAGFDLLTARAVAELAVLAEYALPLLKIGGVFAAFKGPKAAEEVSQASKALEILGGAIEKQLDYKLPDSGDSRCLILIRKEQPTPDKYPRRAGMPLKRPL
jgi:16S rRNA (guanine527-N7)-methyltransferase